MREDRSWNGNFLVPEITNLKLVPELIPKNMWGSAPREYIGWSAWKKLRRLCIDRAGQRCEVCGRFTSKNKLDIHERYTIMSEYLILKRLICVCKKCHGLIHPGFTLSQASNQEEMFKLIVSRSAKINGLDYDTMDKIIKLCFIRHSGLGYVRELDYSMLAQEPKLATCLTSLMRKQAIDSICIEAEMLW